MLESYLITFREGVEIALIVGILLVYLRKIHKTNLESMVFYGLAAAVLVSAAAAVVLEMLAMDFELLEGSLMFIAAVFVTTMIIWMWRTSRHIKKDIEHKIHQIVSEEKTPVGAFIGVFLFTFLMVVREGVETVIFLRAVSSGQGMWGVLVGVVAGVLAAVAFGVLFVKGSVRVDIGKFLKVTAVVLLIFVAQLIVNGIHEFYELGVFPANPDAMAVIGPIVRNNLLFVLAIFSIPAIMFIIPASRRTEIVVTKTNRRWQLATGFFSLIIVFFFGFDYVFANRSSVVVSPAITIRSESGEISIPISNLLDGDLHRYQWISPDTVYIRFFAMRTSPTTFGTAFDACRACYNYGFYYLKDGELICSVCDAPSELSKLAVAAEVDPDQSGSMKGLGCVPLYLPSRISDGRILISTDQLLVNKKYFQTGFDPVVNAPRISAEVRQVH
ncbi:MAG: DUF2318 domain-containing protein [Ignavibacteriales bacterium]|nr:DUF2318 domain-containing protein [Ignavibacteriales bacterium]